MCGIAGVIENPVRTGREELTRRAEAMVRRIAHRGPDRQGAWADEVHGVALGHARLSILDLSSAGNQPMLSRDWRYALSFNGEIYNFRALRGELEASGSKFRGESDTEVLLEACAQWGVERTLPKLDGMFAFALWDRQSASLWLARDRLGEKPLYYGWSSGAFLFASELGALRAYPGFEQRIDRDALSLYFRFACIPAPHSIFEGVYKLPPASFLEVKKGDHSPAPRSYWDLESDIALARQARFEASESEAVGQLDEILKRAVRSRMVSDVPIGAFLSGGVDSSLIVALMQSQSDRPVNTFTIGYDEKDYDEADQASAVAAHLGTRHSTHILTSEEGLKAVPHVARAYDEPFSDPSQLATYLVARHARTQVTVCLSGDGGDEFFAGYHRHFLGESLWKGIGMIPSTWRQGVAGALEKVPSDAWKILSSLKPGGKTAVVADQLRKLVDVLPSASPEELYLKLLSHQRPPGELVLGVGESRWRPRGAPLELRGISEAFQFLDALIYLPNDILTKVDRATMAVALEARVPFLAPEVTRFAWSLPPEFKIRGGRGKWILRRLLERYLPSELIQRPKSGFRVPIGLWMRGPLREWCENLLSESRLRQQGYLDVSQVRSLWDDHLSGRRDREFALWSVLMFQAWLEP